MTHSFFGKSNEAALGLPLRLALVMSLGISILGCVSGSFVNVTTAQEVAAQDGWSDSLDDAIKKSRITGQPVLVKFEAEWCAPCKDLATEFAKPAFKNATEKVILVRIDIDRNKEIAVDFGVEAIPHVILLDSNEETIADRTGLADAEDWVKWLADSLEDTEFEMPEVLASDEPPTRTEIKELIETLGSRDPALRQITMERLIAFPAKTREPLVESLTSEGKLAQKLSVLEILKRWQAPIDGLDPWVVNSFAPEKMKQLNQWKETPIEDLQTVLAELTADDLKAAGQDLDALIESRNVRAGLARMTRYGSQLLPVVYERIKVAKTDEESERLTALRYWLTASNELRLGWANGLIELASSELSSRRAATQSLIKRASLADQPLLLELFADSDPLVRELSLKGLQAIGAKETNATLARLLNDPDPNVRAAVLKSFAESESNEMVEAVANYLETETDADLIVHALRYLKSGNGADALKPVLRFVEHESWQVRAEVAQSLGEIDSDEIEDLDLLAEKGDAVMKLLEDTDGFVVSRAVGALPSRKNKRLLDSMSQIAMRKPEIAGAIVESISESANRFSYDDSSASAAPYLKEFLTNDQAKVREAGLKGMVSNYAAQLTDEDLSTLLADQSDAVRLVALDGFYARIDANRNVQEQVGSQSAVEITPTQSSGGGGLLGLFGFGGSKPELVQPEIEMEDLADSIPVEEIDDGANSNADSGENQSDENQSDENQSDVVKEPKKLKLPKLAEEKWLEKWLDGDGNKIKLDDSTVRVEDLASSEIEGEKVRALACLVALGQLEKLDELISLANGKSEYESYIDSTLKWLPFERRTKVFQHLLDAEQIGRRDALIEAYASVRNPESAKVIWEAVAQTPVSTRSSIDGLMAAYFGNAYSVYYQHGETDIEPDLLELAKIETLQYVETKDVNTQKLVLLMLDKLDPETAKATAKKWIDSEEIQEVEDLAFRLLLKPTPTPRDYNNYNNPPDEDRSYAVEYLKTDKLWKFDLAIQFLAVGEEALAEVEEYSVFFRSNQYFYGSSNSEVKVRIPKPPKGLTLDHLAPKDLTLGAESKAYVAYFRSLLDPKADITDLLDRWRVNKDFESTSKLVFEAVASTNNDDEIPIVEEIFKLHGKNDTSFAADLYWTIRVMDGPNALKLRKKIRDEVGMNRLSNY